MFTVEHWHQGAWIPLNRYKDNQYKSVGEIQRESDVYMRLELEDHRYRILSDSAPVAEWEPGTGWRYFRSAEAIKEWCNETTCQDYLKLKIHCLGTTAYGDKIGWFIDDNIDAANAYLDKYGLLLPEGALPAGLPKVELRTPKDIAAWCRDHFDNQDVRTAIVKARLNIATPRHWVDDAWKDCYANDSTKRIHFNLVRDLHQYPELHRRLSEIIDGYQPEQAPVDVTHGWSPRTIAEWWQDIVDTDPDFHKYTFLKKFRWGKLAYPYPCIVAGAMPSFEDDLNEHPDKFHAACAWLESHDIQAPITIKEAPMATQKSPIFGIKLACGSQIGFQKMEDGRVVFRTAGPSLDGQKVTIEQANVLQVKAIDAAAWAPADSSDEWRF